MNALPRALEERCINTLRFLAADAVELAGSGHPGTPMGAAAMAFVLWHDVLRFDPTLPDWAGRDRFVLSAGHGAMLLYGLLHCAGAGLSLEDLKAFRQWGSLTPGHPERGHTPGVEVTTGPLGQGFATGVGLALGAKVLAAQCGTPLVGYRVFGLVSDGDLQEGVAQEAASLAGRLRLDNLVYLHDANQVTIEGDLRLSSIDDIPARFRAQGWQVIEADGLDSGSVRLALARAVESDEGPTLIEARTTIGHGTPLAGDARCHGAPLGPENIAAARAKLGWAEEPFVVPAEVSTVWRRWREAQAEQRRAWEEALEAWKASDPGGAAHLRQLEERRGGSSPGALLEELLEAAEVGQSDKGRSISGRVLQRAARLDPGLIGGCADLSGSTKTRIEGSDWISPEGGFRGRNIAFGIREHAMAAATNGLALDGRLRAFCSTYLVFSDYLRPALRLAAQMKLPVIHVYSHDSVLAGQDGPTHQPVEQLWSLRALPGVVLFRPADALEVAAAWASALASTGRPHLLVLARHTLAPLARPDGFDPALVLRGGYLLEASEAAAVTLAATGSEVPLAVEVLGELRRKGWQARVVSLPSLELFREQSPAYRDQVIPPEIPLVILEAGVTAPWEGLRRRGDELVIGVDRFGASARSEAVAEHLGLRAGAVTTRVESWLRER